MSQDDQRPRRSPLTVEQQARVAARLSQGVRRLQADASPPSRLAPSHERVDAHAPFPLTDIQQAYLLGRESLREVGGVSAHSYLELALEQLDVARLEQALAQMIHRHEALRTIVATETEQQVLPNPPPYRVEAHDLRARPDADAQLLALRERLSHRVAPPSEWPLFAFVAARLDDERWTLHCSIDLLMLDAHSVLLFYRELMARYADPTLPAPPLAYHFRDYVLAETADRAAAEGARAYWRQRLATLPAAPDLPRRSFSAAGERPTFRRLSARLAPSRWARLQALARAANITSSTLILAAFAEVLRTWSAQPRFTVNVTLFRRQPRHADVGAVLGDFTSVTLLALEPDGHVSFAARAQAVQAQLWRDLDQSSYGGVRVLRDLARERGEPVQFPVVFTSLLGMVSAEAPEVAGMTTRHGISQTPQVHLDHQVSEQAGALVLTWDVVDGLHPTGMLDDMFAAYTQLLDALIDDATRWQRPEVVHLPTSQAARRIEPIAPPILPERLQDALLRQATLAPDAPALITPERTLSRGELVRRATVVASRLRAAGSKRDRPIAVMLERGWQQAVATLGVLLAGAPYLPIDPRLPEERKSRLLSETGVDLVVSDGATNAGVATARIERVPEEDLPEVSFDPALTAPSDLAYVMYTSGSTGSPKGVMIEHAAACNTIADLNRRFSVGSGDRVLAVSAHSFDLSVYDFFGVLGAGGVTVIPEAARDRDPTHWRELIDAHGVTLWSSVPALFGLLLDTAPPRGHTLRLVWLSGDWIPTSLPERARRHWPQATIVSLGGATEAAIWSIVHVIDHVAPEWRSIPYGRPLDHQQWYVLDENLAPRPDWVRGQLYIGGAGLARGYWAAPELTTARFIVHPRTGERLYATGDLGCYWPDGTIEFLGREDSQVKIHGHRIDLSEVEAALGEHPDVREAAVIVSGSGRQARGLTAFVVPHVQAGASIEAVAAKLEPLAQRRFADGTPTISLPHTLDTNTLRHMFLQRQSFRRFAMRPLAADALPTLLAQLSTSSPQTIATSPGRWTAAQLGDWLGQLRRLRGDDLPIDKRLYPSAASLYPVRCHLEVGDDQLADVPRGAYYYDPERHCLVRVGDSSTPRLRLLLTAALPAIAPSYGLLAEPLCWLEAGYMAHLLTTDRTGLGRRLEHALLDVVPASLGLDANELPLLTIAETKPQATVPSLSAFVLVRPDCCSDVRPGLYRWDVVNQRLLGRVAAPLTDDAKLAASWGAQQALFAAAGVTILLVAADEQPRSLVRAGELGQALQLTAPSQGIGLCPVGSGSFAAVGRALGLRPDEHVVHALVGGAIDIAQTASWSVGDDQPLPVKLREHLRRKLPAHMQPQQYIVLAALPLSSTGKVDRAALARPTIAPQSSQFVAPRNAEERLLAQLWSEILEVPDVGIHDDFFRLGGHSLSAIRIAVRARELFGVELPATAVLESPTVAALAIRIAAAVGAKPAPPSSRKRI